MNELLKTVPKVSVRTISNRQRLERSLKSLLAGRATVRETKERLTAQTRASA